jgi:Arc/MetJ-type ribon-helix-helix transcriptional regulator
MKKAATKKRGPGRPRLADPNTTIVSVALSSSDVEGIQEIMDEEGIGSRSEVARGLIQEAIESRLAPGEGEARAKQRLRDIEGAINALGFDGPAREVAIQRLRNSRIITEAQAKELAKPKK